ncbi:hypothetical protein Tco_1152121, partial [Tanacetum coccineum]
GDDDDESSDDDDDDDDAEEEEEDHLAPANSTAVASSAIDLVPSTEETEPFEADESAATPPPPPAYYTTSRMFVRSQTPIPFPPEAEIPPPPTSPTYAQAPLGYRAAIMRAASPPTHYPLPSPTPLPPLPAPSTSRKANILEPGSSVARRVNYIFVDTVEASVRASERRTMVDAQEDRAAMRAEIKVLRRERLAYEQESSETCQGLARSEAHNRALEARIAVLETLAYRHEWQRQDADDRATRHIMRTQALEAGARVDTLEDTGSSTWIYISVMS